MLPRLFLFLLFPVLALQCAADTLYLNSSRGFSPLIPADSLAHPLSNKTSLPRFYYLDFDDAHSRLKIALRFRNINYSADFDYPAEDADGSIRKFKNPYWGLMVISGNDTISIKLSPVPEENPLGSSRTILHLDIAQNNFPLTSQYVKKNYSSNGKNLLLLNRSDRLWTVSIGDGPSLNQYQFVTDNFGLSDKICLILGPAASIDISSLEIASLPDNDSLPPESLEDIYSGITDPDDPLTGIWELYDFDIRSELLSITPHLRFALLPAADGYSLYYLKGYPNNPLWRPGMKKLELKESSFKDIFDVIWIDVTGKSMRQGITATLDYPMINIFFTPQNSKLRLRKINGKNPGQLLYE